MQCHSQTIVRKNAFKSIWEIEVKMFDDSRIKFATEPKTVDGMPDVKWYLECDNRFPVDFFFVVESESQIEYSLIYRFLNISNISEIKETMSTGINRVSLLGITKNEFWNYAKNGKVTFEVQASFLYKGKTFDDFNVCDGSEWGLRLKQNNTKDFDILVDGLSIPIHKFMFTAESPVFSKMFESDFKEAKENKVTITDFKNDIVQAAVDYCYRQNIIEFLKDHKKAMELLRFAEKYDFQTLKPKLEKQIKNNLSKENVFYIASTAEEANSPQIRQACINFVKSHLNNCSTWPFVDMTEIDPFFLKDLVAGALSMKNSGS